MTLKNREQTVVLSFIKSAQSSLWYGTYIGKPQKIQN